MSFPAQAAYIHHGAWSEKTRNVPPFKYLEDYAKEAIDTRSFAKGASPRDHHTEDLVVQKPDGTRVQGADEAWKTIAEVYAPFTGHRHEPDFLVAWETADGWGMVGAATVYFNLHGPVQESVTDPDGEKWHGVGPGAFYFELVTQGDGLKFREIRDYVDSTPAIRLMLKNQHINGDQLAGIVIGS